MNPEVKKMWIEALRSGKYAQTTGTLESVDAQGNSSYCCLGVLCRTDWSTSTSQSRARATSLTFSVLTGLRRLTIPPKRDKVRV